MVNVDTKINVDVTMENAYNQWTQFVEFPSFIEGVEEVQQLSDEWRFWNAEIGGDEKEGYAHITSQVPNEVLAWESEGGVVNTGTAIFKPDEKDSAKTEIELHMEYQPEDFKEKAGDVLGVVSRKVTADMKRFKEFIEA